MGHLLSLMVTHYVKNLDHILVLMSLTAGWQSDKIPVDLKIFYRSYCSIFMMLDEGTVLI